MTTTTEDVTLRLAAAADAPAVRDLVAAAGLPLAGLDDVWVTVVAVRPDGTLAAVAALERHGAGETTAFLLRSVVVEPAHRGTGLGRRLVAATLAHVDPTAPVALLTETAAPWFDRLGFARVARGDLPPSLAGSVELVSACPASATAMLRRT
ncbi:GNAT family N-acetyltransferase [Aquipuribacter nitratireducens]|uniref:GNAT family N-acetyltransferase n=1 Tax=Aquipuribacter nitratireducens TaxID=650104 RepID=A0ABW0GN50_9MICO